MSACDEYSDDIMQEIFETIECWCDAFSETAAFKALPEEAQKNVCFINSAFGEHMYNYHLETPGTWSVAGLDEVITDIFPRKISADESTYLSVEPVLREFFKYLGNMGYIKNADTLTKALKKAAPRMLKKSKDPSNWGLAKRFVMSAMESDVDITDDTEMQKFLNAYNDGTIATNKENSYTPKVPVPKVGRNEPCPCGSGRKYKQCCGK